LGEAKVPQAAIDFRSADAALPYRCGVPATRGSGRGEAEFTLRALNVISAYQSRDDSPHENRHHPFRSRLNEIRQMDEDRVGDGH